MKKRLRLKKINDHKAKKLFVRNRVITINSQIVAVVNMEAVKVLNSDIDKVKKDMEVEMKKRAYNSGYVCDFNNISFEETKDHILAHTLGAWVGKARAFRMNNAIPEKYLPLQYGQEIYFKAK